MIFYEGFESHDILRRFQNLWYFTEILKPIIFYRDPKFHGILRNFEAHDILQRFRDLWYFTKVLKSMVFYRGPKNPWYLTRVLKSMVFYGGFKDFSVNDLMDVLTLGNVKINTR